MRLWPDLEGNCRCDKPSTSPFKQVAPMFVASSVHAHWTGSATETQFVVLHSFVELYSILYKFVWKFYAKNIALLYIDMNRVVYWKKCSYFVNLYQFV